MRWMLGAALLVAACGQAAPPTAPAASSSAATPAAASTRWDANLLQLLPQIDACIALSPQTRFVNYAGEADGGVLVRLDGAPDKVDCRVANGQARLMPYDEALHAPGEGEAIFVRGPGENPGGECYEAPEVRDASGAVIGWMVDPQGC